MLRQCVSGTTQLEHFAAQTWPVPSIKRIAVYRHSTRSLFSHIPTPNPPRLHLLRHPRLPPTTTTQTRNRTTSIPSMANVSTTIKLPSGKSLTVPTGLFINNQFVPAVDGSTLETINPATEALICSVSAGASTSYYVPLSYTNARDSIGSQKDIDLAVAAARKAFNTAWGKKVTGTERGRLIYKLADLMERDMQDLAELESIDNGKPIRIARCALFTSWN